MASESSRFEIVTGDVLETLRRRPSRSARCCITSPPYFAVRDYNVEGQIGLEPTPEEFIQRLVIAFREVRRVLTDDGTAWINMGDTWNSYGGNRGSAIGISNRSDGARPKLPSRSGLLVKNLKNKDLIGIPWMLAFALRADGWYWRAHIVWSKPNPMPESTNDRPSHAHEIILLMSKSVRYYYDADAVREPLAPSSKRAWTSKRKPSAADDSTKASSIARTMQERKPRLNADGGFAGANLKDVWTVAARPSTSNTHFATYPPDLIEPCILAGSAPGDVILDPFCGTGTTGEESLILGRSFYGIDIKPEYADTARRRCAKAVAAGVQSTMFTAKRSSAEVIENSTEWEA